ncbi:D-alanine--D-alanine ligase [uncultured Alphaproteobacteria bacterium]|uniref:D-alanine--D-alanine ligase n=1 Tax=uncultured Alphaproteobacteria bacterium TaxID=91750 RepID=A0A212JKF2_9PROT|nr:D-alanine--D-alanine ligase [uncultured Alphaproteobacteria bacterium]
MSKHVTVLMGGFSAEREVSLTSGAACARALADAGYLVSTLDVPRDVRAIVAGIPKDTDVVFNALHGRFGEDGCIQGILDIMGVPYTHSGRLASALAMDKPMAKHVFAAAGIPVAADALVDRETFNAADPLPRPYVLKPFNEGSSVGVKIVRHGDNREPYGVRTWPYGSHAMVEEYIPGREVTVAVLGDRALGVTEICPAEGFYDYAAKYTEGKAVHVCPAQLPPDWGAMVRDYAVRAHRALGCRGASRADFRLDDSDPARVRCVILEVNTQPGMTPLSLVPEQARAAGMTFEELVSWMVENAQCDG